MKIVNSFLMGEIDRKAQKNYMIPGIVLMENGGRNLYNFLLKNIWNKDTDNNTVYIAGKGNNGGDALVMARHHFLSGNSCTIIVADKKFATDLVKTNFDICEALEINIIEWISERNKAVTALSEAEWIIEGLTGTGLKGELKNVPADIVSAVNKTHAKVCSIDIPSGIGDTYKEGFLSVNANITLTVEIPKFALYTPSGRKKCGEIYSVPIGFPPQLVKNPEIKDIFLDKSDIKTLIPYPLPYSYKNTKGHTLILAGSKGMTGAAVLCSKAAINSLSGLVSLKVTEDIYQIAASRMESVMVDIIDFTNFDPSFIEKYTSVVIGPGWGINKIKKGWLKSFLTESTIPCVIDADAITLLSQLFSEGFIIKNKNCVITPHIGEFSRISGIKREDILNSPGSFLKNFAAEKNITVILKSHVIWIASPCGKISVIDGMNPAMATAGNGDILSGIIGGLISYGLNIEKASSLAPLIHQQAGKTCYNDRGFFSSDKLIDYIGNIIKNGK